MIPAHVAAYAAGLRAGSLVSWQAIAVMLKAVGLGAYDPDELKEAARAWSSVHVAPGALAGLRKKGPPPDAA